MKFAALIVLSLSAMALAGPAFNTKQQQSDYQQQQQLTKGSSSNCEAILKKWCQSSDMSQEQLTSSFKELVQAIKSQPEDESLEQAVMNERICQQQEEQQSSVSNNKISTEAKAHELVKDVYMDALIACDNHKCMKQLNKIIDSHDVDSVRASYYMTRIAVSDKESIKDEQQVISLAQSFIESPKKSSQSVERQQMLAVTALISKHLSGGESPRKEQQEASEEIKKIGQQVASTIVSRYIKPVSVEDVKQYQEDKEPSSQLAMKIAKRNAALKALANLPGWLIAETKEVQSVCLEIAQNKDEMLTARQSAIECLEHCQQCKQQLKQICFDQQQPIEVRIAAYRTLMVTVGSGEDVQQADQIVKQIVEHCEDSRNQQQDDQFVLYVISHLQNLSTSQQAEHETLKECIEKNKQVNMKIQLLNKKFKRVLSDVRKSSRNYKLEQEFNQLESGLIIEGDLIYESQKQQQQQQAQILPKLVRVNMSMPIMGETVNVIEVSVRQNQMDEQFLTALNLLQVSGKSGQWSVRGVMDSFQTAANKQQQQQQQQHQQQQRQQQPERDQEQSGTAEADLSIKIDGCTVVYLSVDDFKTNNQHQSGEGHQRNIRSTYSIVDDVIQHLKRKPIAFNRGFNFNINERFAKLLDVDASIIAGLRFESRANGHSSEDFEIVAQAEPRFAFEAVVGPAKVNKKLLQRVSTKSALGLRLRFKRDQLVDVQVELPYQTMELFTVESKIVEETGYGNYVDVKPQEGFGLLKKKSNSVFDFMQSKRGIVDQTYRMNDKLARTTGLRTQVRVVAQTTGFMAQALVQKYEPSMQGYRFQLQSTGPMAPGQEQYLLVVSTPGSQIDRTMQVRITKQSVSGRYLVKSEIKSPKMSLVSVLELVHDGRQTGLKAEIASVRGAQWRHSATAGVQWSSSARFGTYKPYLSIKSSQLRRPIEMQGTVSVQQEPKFVVTYNMKCPTSGDFVQGKLIVDQRSSVPSSGYSYRRRSMRSPVELILQRDITLTKEIVAQVEKYAIKAHTMVDWDSSKYAINTDSTLSTKNLVKSSEESQYNCGMKLDAEQQKIFVERKSVQQPHKNFRYTVSSLFTSPSSHQLNLECVYHGKRQPSAIVAYKHIVDAKQSVNGNKLELVGQVELIASEYNVNEKLTGRTDISFDRKMKSVHTELTGRNKQCKINVDFASWAEHQIELKFNGPQHQHQTLVRADRRQFVLQSQTNQYNKIQGKFVITADKQQGECQIIFECPVQQIHMVADLKPSSGKQSSIAIQTPRIQTKAEFYYDTMSSTHIPFGGKHTRSLLNNLMPINQLRFKTDLKDMINQEAYWMDSSLNRNSPSDKSYFRVDSPIYRTDIEYDPSSEETKFGLFARSKRSTDSYKQLYSSANKYYGNDWEQEQDWTSSKLRQLGGDKLWMIRSLISSPSSWDQLKQKARRALFEYADQRQGQKHTINYQPIKGINFDWERKPFGGQQDMQSMRLKGDLNMFTTSQQDMRPSRLSMESDMLDLELEAKPYWSGSEESYAKLNAVSRYPRSTFKHQSELSYKKQHGYKANMKHEDQEGKRHSWQLEADESPKHWAKMSYESEKHGKGEAEYNWRKHLTQRPHDKEEVYRNKLALKAQGPRGNVWSHESNLSWDEPRKMFSGRVRRDIFNNDQQDTRYNIVDYLKHVEARLDSRTNKNQEELYNVDFDYKPYSHARLNVQMPEDMSHSSSFEFQPSERLYKLQSKLFNRRTQQPSYQLLATTKPITGLATAQQEPVFVDYQQHPILERPITSTVSNLFRQPLRLDYSDKYGRVANVDYDFSPMETTTERQLYSGLRQKRAAVYYKDDDFEHTSSYDFYPETVFGQVKPSKRVPGDFTMKAQTKYGPIVLEASSNGQQAELKLDTPVIDAEISCQTERQGAKLFQINLDNKQQRVKLNKIVRKTPILEDLEFVKDLAQKIDESRFEHESQLLVNFVEAILKLKSETKMNERPVMVIDAELNKQLEKAFVKVDGERVNGQLAVDLVNMSTDLVLDVDDKRTLQHRTRLVRVSPEFYSMESMTSYKSEPLVKLTAKICAKVFDASHIFSRRHSAMPTEHMSTFDAVIYTESKPKQITGQYDCLKKEARVFYKDLSGRTAADVRIKYDEQLENVFVAARTVDQDGTTKQIQKTIDVSSLVEAY